jgi:hypothetical protein
MATTNYGFARKPGASHEESVWDYIGPLACSFPIDALSLGSRSRADRTDETVTRRHVENEARKYSRKELTIYRIAAFLPLAL